MRKPLSPLQALQLDASNAAARGADDDVVRTEWIAVAQLACDLAARWGALSDVPDLAPVLDRETLLQAVEGRPTMVHDGRSTPGSSLGTIAERLRVHAEAMENHGCFELALTTVSAVCRLTARADAEAHALATLHLGRIARQMNELDAAEDAYAAAIARSLQVRQPAIAARGHVGLALIADMRGNQPRARKLYQEALRQAVPDGGTYRQAMQGLLSLAVARQDLGEALVLGWRLYDLSADDPATRQVALMELSIVALHAGFYREARHGFGAAIPSVDSARLRLVALGGDIRAAARLGEAPDVARLAAAIEKEAARSSAHHETAMALVHAAEAWHLVAEPDRAARALVSARQLANRCGFHEYVFAADALEQSWRSATTTPAPQPGGTPAAPVTPSLRRMLRRFAVLA